MKKKLQHLSKGVIILTAISFLLSSCAKFEQLDFYTDEPQSVIDQEALNAYDDLKSYVNYPNMPHFKLGATLYLDDVINNSLLYRLVQRNFDEIHNTSELNHIDFVQADGNITLGRFQQFLDLNEPSEIPVYTGHLVWHEKQQSAYINSLIADIIIPGDSGSDMIADFESNELGDSYPMSNGGTSAVVNDPDGDSGKALRVEGVQTFPQFTVNLPEGRTLGNYQSVTIDFKGAGCCGLYGQGMRLGISTTTGSVSLVNFRSPANFGAPDNQWARGRIILPLADLNLTSSQREMTSFVVTVGSATGAADYLIDNVSMQWEIPGDIIIKTPEEKTEIIREELDRWIKEVVELGKDRVGAWSLVYQPMDEDNPSELRSGAAFDPMPENTFFWQDYLGKDFAAIAGNMVKQYSNTDDKLFITETNLLGNSAKVQGLIDFVNYTDGQGTIIDGIGIELPIDITTDKSSIHNLLESLAATGKLVKISALDIGIGTTTAQATKELYTQQNEMYQYVLQKYFDLIPADQRAGITFRSPVDNTSSSVWRPNEPVGLWNSNYIRKSAYEAVVEVLAEQ